MPKKYGKKNSANTTETFKVNKNQMMKNTGVFRTGAMNQMPKNSTFGKISKTHG